MTQRNYTQLLSDLHHWRNGCCHHTYRDPSEVTRHREWWKQAGKVRQAECLHHNTWHLPAPAKYMYVHERKLEERRWMLTQLRQTWWEAWPFMWRWPGCLCIKCDVGKGAEAQRRVLHEQGQAEERLLTKVLDKTEGICFSSEWRLTLRAFRGRWCTSALRKVIHLSPKSTKLCKLAFFPTQNSTNCSFVPL